MRIVNEDDQDAAANHLESNRLLGATPLERAPYESLVKTRDEQRNPLSSDLIDAALTKGSTPSAFDVFDLSIFPQVKVMYFKRFRQFSRSKGQFSMGFFVPIGAIALICLILHEMSTQLLSAAPPAIVLPYFSTMKTLIAGPPKNSQLWANNAFGGTAALQYVGNSYTALFNSVSQVASSEKGVNSSEAIAFGSSMNNYTVMYNASYPINFAGAASYLLENGVTNATKGGLSFVELCQYLPYTSFGLQVNQAYFTSLLMVSSLIKKRHSIFYINFRLSTKFHE